MCILNKIGKGLIFFLSFLILFSCKNSDNDKPIEIFRLEPNKIYVNADTLDSYGWFSKSRSDFFVVKNYNDNNEQHKLIIDSFVVAELKKDNFLAMNINSEWSMTFFRYGKGIYENTEHTYGTDYAIHTLFSYKKQIANYFFNNRVGYAGTSFTIEPKKVDSNKRKIVIDYFNSIDTSNPALLKMISATLRYLGQDPNEEVLASDTIKVVATFIDNDDLSKPKTAQYKVLKSFQENLASVGDTINITYSDVYQPNISAGESTIELIRYKLKFNSKYHYIFQEDKDVRLTIAAE